jgi:hypothetical protein
MPDDYLWDKTGEPDAEVERLERLLGQFREDVPAPDVPAPARAIQSTRRFWIPLAAAAALLLAFGTWVAVHWYFRTPGWEVARLEGTPRIGGRPLGASGRLAVGEWLVTDAASRAELNVDGLGIVEVGPNSRLHLVKATLTQQHFVLERGFIRAQILAPPYVFIVHTPSAYAMDMGCAYTLDVKDDGSGVLRVTSGWVDFQHGDRQSLVPAGAAAETRPGIGPGAPYFEDASERFRAALSTVNFDIGDSQARTAAFSVVLAEARRRDAFTLLNLFRRVEPEDRGRLFDRISQSLPPLPADARAQVVAGNLQPLGPWWNALGIGHPKKGLFRPPHVDY